MESKTNQRFVNPIGPRRQSHVHAELREREREGGREGGREGERERAREIERE